MKKTLNILWLILFIGCANLPTKKILADSYVTFSANVINCNDISEKNNVFLLHENDIPIILSVSYFNNSLALNDAFDAVFMRIWNKYNINSQEISEAAISISDWSGKKIFFRNKTINNEYWVLKKDHYLLICGSFYTDADKTLATNIVDRVVSSIDVISPKIISEKGNNIIYFSAIDKSWKIVLPATMKFIVDDNDFIFWPFNNSSALIRFFPHNEFPELANSNSVIETFSNEFKITTLLEKNREINGWLVSIYCDNPQDMKNYVSIANKDNTQLMFVASTESNLPFTAEEIEFFNGIWNNIFLPIAEK